MILCILDDKKAVREFYIKKRIKPYAIATVSCIVFSYIYSLFSHGVSSPYMTFMFLFPLIFGVLGAIFCIKFKKSKRQHFLATHFYHTGVVTLVLGSMLGGIFEIAGTASLYQTVLMIVGTFMVLCGVLCYIIKI